jgi:hypothetical protein
MALGMGCPVLRRFTEGLPEGPYLTFRDTSLLVSQATEILGARSGDHAITPGWSSAALSLGKEARSWCLEQHTLAHRCKALLEMVRVRQAARIAVALAS